MDDRSKLARNVMIAGIALGVAGDALLRVGPWSLNFTLWIAAVLGSALALAARHRVDWPHDLRWLFLPVLLFAGGVAWRASPVLKFLDLVAIGLGVSVWALGLERLQTTKLSVLDYVRGMLNVGMAAAKGATPLAHAGLALNVQPRDARWIRARSAIVGLLIALPLLLVFGGLLMAADAVFDQMISTVIDVDFANLSSHAAFAAFLAWVACGFLLLMVRFARPTIAEPLEVGRPGIGAVEIAVPLALIDLLFLAFVIVQLRYLFGDASLVEETVGLTYAEYARRGFFELVTVAALVLPLLLAADWLLAGARPASQRVYRALARVMLLLLLVIVASALKRMMLYQSAYGLTEQRLYTTAFMAWVGIVLVWFTVTVLHGRRRYFATGAALAGFSLIAALNVINPDALIARVNTTRAIEGKEFDAYYATLLSADAVPTLLDALPALDPDQACVIAARVLDRWSPSADEDWRTWNAGRAAAWSAVKRMSVDLERLACPAADEADLPTTNLEGSAEPDAATVEP